MIFWGDFGDFSEAFWNLGGAGSEVFWEFSKVFPRCFGNFWELSEFFLEFGMGQELEFWEGHSGIPWIPKIPGFCGSVFPRFFQSLGPRIGSKWNLPRLNPNPEF